MTTALLILGRNTDGLITPLYAGAMALSVSGCNRGWPSGTTIAERPKQDTIMADTVVERPKKDTTMADTTQVNIGHRMVILGDGNEQTIPTGHLGRGHQDIEDEIFIKWRFDSTNASGAAIVPAP